MTKQVSHPTRRQASKLLGGTIAAAAIIRSRRASAATTIRLGAPRVPHYAAAWLVSDYMPEGMKVEIIEYKAATEMVSALVAGNVDVSCIGYWHLMRLLDVDADVQAVSGLCSGGTRFVVRKGVEVKDWPDLKGKTCAVARGSIQDVQLLLSLKNKGMSVRDINYRDLGGSLAVHISALQQGQVDASSMWEPFASQVIQQGIATEFSTLYDTSFRINGLMAARSAFVKSNPEAVKAVASAAVKATEKLNSDPTGFLDFAVKLSGFPRDTMALANKNVFLEYEMRKKEVYELAAAVHDFGYVTQDVRGKLAGALNYDILSQVTGKRPEELGA